MNQSFFPRTQSRTIKNLHEENFRRGEFLGSSIVRQKKIVLYYLIYEAFHVNPPSVKFLARI